MKSIEHYREQIIRAADHAFVDSKKSVETVEALLGRIFDPRGGTFYKAVSLFRLVRNFVPEGPESQERYRRFFRNPTLLPFDPEKYNFSERIGSGHNSDVFLLEAQGEIRESLVMKLEYIGTKDLSQLEDKAKQNQKDYKFISEWYKSISGLIPPIYSLVLHSPVRKGGHKAAVVSVQRFMGRHLQDVALEITQSEWQKLVAQNSQLLEQLREFVRITKQHIGDEGRVIDLLGRKNLSVAESKQGTALVFIDPQGIDRVSDMTEKERMQVRNRIELLNSRLVS